MGEYLLLVFSVCAISAVCGLMSYKGCSAEKLALGILVLYTVTMPVIRLVDEWNGELTLPDMGGIDTSDPEYESVARGAFEEGLCRHICDRLDLTEECVRVRVFGLDVAEMKAERISVLLSGKGALCDYRALEKYLNELELGECDVEIEI